MKKYEFNIVVVGYGESVDEAFHDILDSLKEDPEVLRVVDVAVARATG